MGGAQHWALQAVSQRQSFLAHRPMHAFARIAVQNARPKVVPSPLSLSDCQLASQTTPRERAPGFGERFTPENHSPALHTPASLPACIMLPSGTAQSALFTGLPKRTRMLHRLCALVSRPRVNLWDPSIDACHHTNRIDKNTLSLSLASHCAASSARAQSVCRSSHHCPRLQRWHAKRRNHWRQPDPWARLVR